MLEKTKLFENYLEITEKEKIMKTLTVKDLESLIDGEKSYFVFSEEKKKQAGELMQIRENNPLMTWEDWRPSCQLFLDFWEKYPIFCGPDGGKKEKETTRWLKFDIDDPCETCETARDIFEIIFGFIAFDYTSGSSYFPFVIEERLSGVHFDYKIDISVIEKIAEGKL